MHYTRKINGTEDAVKEAKKWLGEVRFNLLVVGVRNYAAGRAKHTVLRELYFFCDLAGMQGRALVHGLFRHIFGANHV